jgi:WD40 repeat protein
MSFDGKTVATASSDMTAKVFNIRNGALLRTFTGHDGPIHSIQHDSEKVITGSNDCTIRIWDNHGKGNLLGIFKYHTKPITCLKLCNEMLISGSEDKTGNIVF